MVPTRFQGQQDGQQPPEEGPQHEFLQQIGQERQLDERNHVFEVLNLNDDAIQVMNLQNIMSVLRIISTRKNIYDGLASSHRGHRTSTDSEHIALFQAMVEKVQGRE